MLVDEDPQGCVPVQQPETDAVWPAVFVPVVEKLVGFVAVVEPRLGEQPGRPQCQRRRFARVERDRLPQSPASYRLPPRRWCSALEASRPRRSPSLGNRLR